MNPLQFGAINILKAEPYGEKGAFVHLILTDNDLTEHHELTHDRWGHDTWGQEPAPKVGLLLEISPNGDHVEIGRNGVTQTQNATYISAAVKLAKAMPVPTEVKQRVLDALNRQKQQFK